METKSNILTEKWHDLIDKDSASKVKNKEAMAQLLENEEEYSLKEGAVAADMAQYTPILVPAVRRIFPNLLANEIVGVQPMNSPVGYAYALRYSYDRGQGPNDSDRGTIDRTTLAAATKFVSCIVLTSVAPSATDTSAWTSVLSVAGSPSVSGTIAYQEDGKLIVAGSIANVSAIKAASSVVVNYGASATSGTYTVVAAMNNEAGYNSIFKKYSGPVSTAVGETMGAANGAEFRAMKMGLERVQVEVQTRKLKAEYTIELAQDLKAIHSLDAEAELINILEYEITAELDRELAGKIYDIANPAPAWTYGQAGAPSGTQADGRWEAEKFRTLYTKIIREANQVALTSRRGTANFIITSANVVSALESLSNFMYSSVPGDVKPTLGVAKVGTLDGRFTVYMDTFATSDFVVVGYKGATQFDTGVIYCPYIPLMLQKAQDPNTFQPKVAFLTRDAICANLYGAQNYYRKFDVDFTGSSLGNGYSASYMYDYGYVNY